MIVNAVFNVLAQFAGLGASVEDSVAAPRIHTDGNLGLTVEAASPEADVEFLKGIGYSVRQGNVANTNTIFLHRRALMLDTIQYFAFAKATAHPSRAS